jgi:hypothetical protein
MLAQLGCLLLGLQLCTLLLVPSLSEPVIILASPLAIIDF